MKQGDVVGEKASEVRGTIIDGIINLKMAVDDEIYHLEAHDTHPDHTHMIYRASDVSLGKSSPTGNRLGVPL